MSDTARPDSAVDRPVRWLAAVADWRDGAWHARAVGADPPR